jgi:hypothetical protein
MKKIIFVQHKSFSMKKLILLTILIQFSLLGFSQCKWAKEGTDSFTGEKNFVSKKWTVKKNDGVVIESGSVTEALILVFNIDGNKANIRATYGIATGRKDRIFNNFKFSIKLESGDIISINKFSTPSIEVFCCYTTDIGFTIPVNSEQADKLATSPPKLIRIEFNDIKSTFELSKKEASKLAKTLICFGAES